MSTAGFAVEVNGIKSDLSTIEDAKSRDALQSLGLTSVDGNMTLSGNWDAEDGLVDIEEYTLDFANVGKLAFAFSFSGYTMDFIKSAQQTATAMESANKESKDAAGLAMMGMMQRSDEHTSELKSLMRISSADFS